jgi:hypothetical protein
VSAIPAAVSFQILTPIWQRWWFVAAALLAVGLGAHALHRHRVRRLLELSSFMPRERESHYGLRTMAKDSTRRAKATAMGC